MDSPKVSNLLRKSTRTWLRRGSLAQMTTMGPYFFRHGEISAHEAGHGDVASDYLNIDMEAMALIEIDGLPIRKVVIFHGKL